VALVVDLLAVAAGITTTVMAAEAVEPTMEEEEEDAGATAETIITTITNQSTSTTLKKWEIMYSPSDPKLSAIRQSPDTSKHQKNWNNTSVVQE